jgi:hypothetical protein
MVMGVLKPKPLPPPVFKVMEFLCDGWYCPLCIRWHKTRWADKAREVFTPFHADARPLFFSRITPGQNWHGFRKALNAWSRKADVRADYLGVRVGGGLDLVTTAPVEGTDEIAAADALAVVVYGLFDARPYDRDPLAGRPKRPHTVIHSRAWSLAGADDDEEGEGEGEAGEEESKYED